MIRDLCPRCGAPWSNSAAHVETPELARHGPYEGERVYWCVAGRGAHVVVPTTWAEDLSGLGRSIARTLQHAAGKVRR